MLKLPQFSMNLEVKKRSTEHIAAFYLLLFVYIMKTKRWLLLLHFLGYCVIKLIFRYDLPVMKH